MWHVPVSLRITLVDMKRLQKALRFVIEQTVGLHVVFTEENGVLCKRIDENLQPEIEILDFSREGEHAYLAWAQKQAEKPLPMLDSLLYRLGIADVGDQTAYVFSIYHHILADGTSSNLIFRHILELYKAFGRGESIELPEHLPFQTAFDAEQEYLESAECEEDKAYWNTLAKTANHEETTNEYYM